MLRAWGFSGRPVGLAVVVMSVWNQLVILGFPILAVAGLAARGGPEPHAGDRGADRARRLRGDRRRLRDRPLERAARTPGRRPRRTSRQPGQGA